MDNVSLIKLCESTFSEKEIEEAKSLLFESIKTDRNKITRRKDGKNKRNLEDIVSVFKEVDPELMPIFVARDLQKLPPASIDHIDTVTLLKDITNIRNEINTFKEQYVTTSQFQALQTELKNIKEAKVPVYSQTNYVNSQKREGFLLDSLPFGLLHTTSNENASVGSCETVEISNFECRSVSECKQQSPSCTHAQSYGVQALAVPTPTTLPEPEIDIANDMSKAEIGNKKVIGETQATMADVLLREGEWKQNKPSEEWIKVQKKKLRNRFIGRTGKALPDMESHFKAADIRIPLFISNVNKEVTEENICDYLQMKAQVSANVEKIIMKQERPYNAFKIYVPKHKLETCLNDNFWPDGVKFRQFVHLRRNALPAKETANAVRVNSLPNK